MRELQEGVAASQQASKVFMKKVKKNIQPKLESDGSRN